MSFRIIIFLSTISFLSSFSTHGQSRLEQIKGQYKDEAYVVLSDVSSYKFIINEERDVNILNTENTELFATENNVEVIKRLYYNDKSSIEKNSIKSGKGAKIRPQKFCGHYEVSNIFYSDAQVCAYKFTLYNTEDRAIFKSTKLIRDPKYLTKAFFHKNTPALVSKIEFSIPDNIEVELIEFNFERYNIKKDSIYDAKNKITTYQYSLSNVDKMSNEDSNEGILRLYPHILILTKSYQVNENSIAVLSSTDDLYAWYRSLVLNIDTNNETLKPIVEDLLKTAETTEEKVKSIYYWIQDNIKYIAYEDGLAGFEPEDAKTVFYNKYGDCKGMANLTKSMLEIAGLDARLSWIGTDKIPYTYDTPSLAVDNHMICTLLDGENRIFLDATEKHLDYGINSERIQGKQILIENGDDYILDRVPVQDSIANTTQRVENLTIENGLMLSQGSLSISGQDKQNMLSLGDYVTMDKKDKLYQFIVAQIGIDREDFDILENPEINRDEDLVISYNYHTDENISEFGNEFYISMDHVRDYENLTLDTTRVGGYKLANTTLKKATYTLEIPEGYSVNHLPEAYHFTHNNYDFHLTYIQKESQVVYSKEIVYRKNLIEKKDFKQWNEHIEALKTFYNDQIILSK